MVSTSKVENLAQRFAPYIEELQEFFRSRHIPYGHLADLDNFPAHLADPGFQEEMVSMVRSILYRECEAIPRTELMEMVVIAVGGSQMEEAAPNLHAPLRQILNFITDVVRSQRAALPSELPPEDTPAVEQPSPHAPLHLIFTQPAPPSVAADLPILIPPADAPQADRAPTNDRLSRALIDSEDSAAVPSASSPFLPPAPAIPPVNLSSRRPSSTSLSAFLRRAYWIPGVFVLLLAVATAVFLQNRNHSHSQPPPAYAPTAAAITTLPKPGAYGPTLARARRSDSSATSQAPNTSAPTQRLPESSTAPENAVSSRTAAKTALPPPARHPTTPMALTSSRVTPRVLGGREGVFLASSGMMAAHLLTAPAPGYPKLASLTHVEGEVIVQVVVARDGTVEATRVLQGPRLLRGAAEHAIRHWRYRPYLMDGKPTDVATIVTVNFRLSR